jgi:hypothetical protein
MVGGFGNTLNKSDCKLGSGHQVKVSGEKSPPLSSTLENVEDFMVSTTASKPPQLLREMVLKEWVSWTIQCVVWQNWL